MNFDYVNSGKAQGLVTQRARPAGRRPKAGLAALLGRVLVTTMLIAVLATASAQFEVTGTIEGSLDGETRNWYTLEYQSEGADDGTAWLRNLGNEMFTMMLVEIQAHDEPRYKIEGTITLGGSLTQPFEECPCTLTEVEILYFPSSSMFSNVYQSIEAEMIVDSIETADDGSIHLSGTFSAVLGLVEDVMQGTDPDPERSITVAGEFDIARVLTND